MSIPAIPASTSCLPEAFATRLAEGEYDRFPPHSDPAFDQHVSDMLKLLLDCLPHFSYTLESTGAESYGFNAVNVGVAVTRPGSGSVLYLYQFIAMEDMPTDRESFGPEQAMAVCRALVDAYQWTITVARASGLDLH